MTKKKALIFSKNEKLGAIISAELSLLDYLPRIIGEPITDITSEKDAALIVVDTTELEITQSHRAALKLCRGAFKLAIVGAVGDRVSAHFDKTLRFPFPLSEFRDAVTSASSSITNGDSNNVIKCFFADKQSSGVTFGDTFVALSDYEMRLLRLLCENSGKCVSREEIMKAFDATDGNISDVYICHLRNKLEAPFGTKVIYTVRGKGYTTDYVIK